MPTKARTSSGASRPVTPLWIVALFVSLTETVLGIAVTRTAGAIQVALLVFVILFPTLVAGVFFLILWRKPFVFYSPAEFGGDVAIRDYLEAMLIVPAQISGKRDSAMGDVARPEASPAFVEYFSRTIPTAAWEILYACSKAHMMKRPFHPDKLFSTPKRLIGVDWARAFLFTARAAGVIDFSSVEDVVTITYVNPSLATRAAENVRALRQTLREDVRALYSEELDAIDAHF